MSRMSDQPLTLGNLATALAQFHRDIVRPDIVQIVNDAVTDSERRAQVNFDAIFRRLDRMLDSPTSAAQDRTLPDHRRS